MLETQSLDYAALKTRVNKKDIDLIEFLVKTFNVSEIGPWITGGAIRRLISGEKLDSDVDFFFNTQEQFDNFCKIAQSLAAEPGVEREFNKTFKIKVSEKDIVIVQGIKHKFYKNIDELLDSFDFTICQFAFDNVFVYTGNMSLVDLYHKKLVTNQITYGVSSMRRALKYTNQGFTMCSGSMKELLEQIAKQNGANIRSEVISVD